MKKFTGLRLRLNAALVGLALGMGGAASALPHPQGHVPGLLLLGCGLLSGGTLLWLVYGRILRPLRRLGREVGGTEISDDDVEILARRVRRLYEKILHTEAQLEESHESLRQTEKLAMAGKLAAGVAHSIRNPLTGIKLRLFSLTRGLALNEKQQEDMAAIQDAIRHMEAITTNFLEFSRRPRLRVAPVRLSHVVDSTLSLLQPRLESFQVRVERRRPDAAPPLLADAEQLREALINLIVNACEAMGVGGVLSLVEEYGRLAPLGRVAVLRVDDSGPGIPADMHDAVFQPFISTKAEGTGLGLPIARRIFEEHGGWLHLHCAPGRGASFVAVLPAREDEHR